MSAKSTPIVGNELKEMLTEYTNSLPQAERAERQQKLDNFRARNVPCPGGSPAYQKIGKKDD